MELQSKRTELESSLKVHDEELSKIKAITFSIWAEITTISTSPLISAINAVILQKLKGLLETK
jgi:hypothetical protein